MAARRNHRYETTLGHVLPAAVIEEILDEARSMKMRYRAAGLAVGLVMMFSVTVECRLSVVARHPHETWLPSICYGAAGSYALQPAK